MDKNSLEFKEDGLTLYHAGLPHFPRNFSRDSIVSSLIAKDTAMLRDQLIYCAIHQGQKSNSQNGEEPGKIHHELPEFIIDGLSTKYAACDTAALFLIGHQFYKELTGDGTLVESQRENILRAAEYIKTHIKNGLFVEDPSFSGSHRFALKVTYWKDSAIPSRSDGEPDYPVVYPLAHIQNLAGIRAAAKLLAADDLTRLALAMQKALPQLFDPEFGTLFIGLDKKGPIKGITSDSLHALYYLETEDVTQEQIQKIVSASRELETPAGYRTMSVKTSELMGDKYHANTVWPFEQAIISMGAEKFGLPEVSEISRRVFGFMDTFPEILVIGENSEIKKGGCDPQLWSLAAVSYFTLEMTLETKILPTGSATQE